MVDIVDLRNLVAEAEGTTDERAAQENFASGYDLPFGYGRYLQPSKPISQMTFQELRDFQKRQVNATKGTFDNTNRGTSAVGRYQFIGPTLENLKNRLGYKDTDVFSPEVQDRLFDALMEEQGLQELSAGLITPEEFQEKLSSQFASIPKPGTETGTYKGQGTGVTSDRVSAVLSSMQDPSGRGDTFRPEDDTVSSDTGTVTGDQAEEEPGFLDTVGEYVGDAYDAASEYVNETVDTLEGVAESVGEKLRRLLGSEEEQQSSTLADNPPIPERRPVVVDEPPVPEPRPDQTEEAFSDVEDFVGTLKKAEGGSVEKEVEFVKEDDDDVPDPPPGATPEEVADDIPAYLSTGEYVLPANVVRYIGLKNITDMHQRALAELQQMEDLDIIENVDEDGYVEEDDDEMDYMKPEGVVEIVVAEHHPKGLMAKGFAEGGMIEGYKYVPGVGYRPEDTAVTELQESAGDLGEYVSGVGFVRPPESDDRPMPSQKSSQADAKAEAIVSILDGIHSVYDENEGVTTQQFFGKDEEGNLIGPDDPRTQEQLFKLSEAAGEQTFKIIQNKGENSDMAPRDKGIARFLRNVAGPNLPGRVISDEYLAKGLTKLKKDIPEKVYEREDVTGKFYNPEDPQDIFSGDLLKSGDTGPARNAVTLSPEGKSLSVADMMAASIGKEYAQQGRSDTPGGGNTQFGGAGVKSYPGTQAGWKAFTSDVGQGFKDLGSFMTFGGLATTIGKGLMNAFDGKQTFTSVGSQGLPASIAKGGFVTKQGIMRPRSCD